MFPKGEKPNTTPQSMINISVTRIITITSEVHSCSHKPFGGPVLEGEQLYNLYRNEIQIQLDLPTDRWIFSATQSCVTTHINHDIE